MQRLLAGLLIALGCHGLLFMVPIPLHPVSHVRILKSTGITVRFHRMTVKAAPKKDRHISLPKSMLPLEEDFEKTTPPAPRQKSPPKSQPAKIKFPARPIRKPRPVLQKSGSRPAPENMPAGSQGRAPKVRLPGHMLPDQLTLSLSIHASGMGKKLHLLRRPGTSIAMGEKTGSASHRVIRVYPKIDGNPPPRYPILARRRGWQGTVLLSVQIQKNGRAGSIAIEKSSGYSILDKAALRAVSRYQFVPGQQDGRPIAMRVRVPVHFRLQDID